MNKKIIVLIAILSLVLITACKARDVSKDNLDSNIETKEINETKTEKEDVILSLGSINDFEKSKEGQSLIFDTLTKIDSQYVQLPNIVNKWEVSEDKKTYKISFLTDVKFHDGEEVTAKDILYAIKEGGENRYCSYAYILDNIEVLDDSTIEINLSSPYIYMIEDLAKLPLVKEGAWSKEGLITNMIGTGPFIFESTDAGSVTTLTKNNNYWNKDYKTDIDIIKWHAISDEQTRKMALISGQVDALGLSEHYISMPYTVIKEIKENDKFKSISEDEDSYTSVGSLEFNWKKGITSNVDLRRAFLYLFDREELVRDIFFDIPNPTGHIYNPKFDDGPKLKAFSYDPNLAKEYLEKAGFILGDQNTPTVNKDGEVLSLELMYGNEEYEEDLALYLVNAAKKYGIELRPLKLDWTGKSEKFHSGDYDIVIGHPWFVPLIDSLGYMGLTDEYTDYGLGFAVNDKMKEAGLRFLQATSKEEIKKEAENIWEIQYDQAICVPLFADLRYILHNDKFENLHFDPNVFQIDLNGVVLK